MASTSSEWLLQTEMSKRKLSNIEHLAEVNIACSVRLAGKLKADELQMALARVQGRHPALRALIRAENDVLWYEPDAAPEIPVRTVRNADDQVYRCEWEVELSTAFDHALPQLRVAYFERESECDLLFTTSHRVCDGLSIFIIVKEVLCSLAGQPQLKAHKAVCAADIIGEYQPPRAWLTSTGVALVNTCLRLLPASPAIPKRKECFAEWSAGPNASASLRQRCRAEGVSVHAAFLVALDRALSAVLGPRSPKWITCPIDLRRGRFPRLKEDMLFYGGGNFKVRTGRWIESDFWDNARAQTVEVRSLVEREVLQMRGRLFWFEKLRPLTSGQAHWLVRVSDALQSKRRIKGIGLANLGSIQFSGIDCPLPIKDVRFSARSLNFGVLGLIAYTINGEMRFYCMNSDTVFGESEVCALQQEFMRTLERQIEWKWAEAVTA